MPAPWLKSGRAGEDWFVRQMRDQSRFGARPPDTVTETPQGKRRPDFIEQRPDGSDVAHEIKTGIPRYDPEDLLKQCHKDGYLLRSGLFGDVVWHFLPFAGRGADDIALGMDQSLLDCLRTERIPFTIHPPATP